MQKTVKGTMSQAAAALGEPIPFDVWLEKLSARDRLNVERHLAACTADEHTRLWKRLACALATLAPHAAQTAGQEAVQFYVADGKYKMQVFALEDRRDGNLVLYTEDVRDAAVKAGLLRRAAPEDLVYRLITDESQFLSIEPLDQANTPNPPPFFKHMLGWNRKAIRVTIPVNATDKQIFAAEMLCALTARQWKTV